MIQDVNNHKIDQENVQTATALFKKYYLNNSIFPTQITTHQFRTLKQMAPMVDLPQKFMQKCRKYVARRAIYE